MTPRPNEQRRIYFLTRLLLELQQAILQHSEIPTTRDRMIILAIYLEDVRKIKAKYNAVEKAKSESLKPESSLRAESALNRAAAESKNNCRFRRRERDYKPSELIS